MIQHLKWQFPIGITQESAYAIAVKPVLNCKGRRWRAYMTLLTWLDVVFARRACDAVFLFELDCLDEVVMRWIGITTSYLIDVTVYPPYEGCNPNPRKRVS